MLVKHKLFFLIISFSILLIVRTFSSAQDKVFYLNEKWSLELPEPVTAVRLYDINDDCSEEIFIGTGSLRYNDSFGILQMASDSARDIIATSGELPYGISCIEVANLDQNSIPEILAGMSAEYLGGVCIFSDAELDSFIIATEESYFPAVVSLKTVPLEDGMIVYVATVYETTSGYETFDQVGCVFVGTGYLSDLHEIYWGDLVEQIEFGDLDQDEQYELVLSEFRWTAMGLRGTFPTSAGISIRIDLPDSVIKYGWRLFAFTGLWDIINRGGFTSLEIGNCDSDSYLEVLGSAFVDTCFPMYLDTCCLTVLSAGDGLTKEEEWRATYFGIADIIRGIALIDFNQDGMNEVLVAHQNAPMELLNGEDGSKIAESDSTYKVDYFAFGDVDGDGENEIVIADGNTLRVFEPDFTTDVPEEEENAFSPEFITLGQNYPNPFNSTTTIPFALKRPAHTALAIYNILGQKVRTLLDEKKVSGDYRVVWDGKNEQGKIVPSGIYFYKVTSREHSESKKMLFLK